MFAKCYIEIASMTRDWLLGCCICFIKKILMVFVQLFLLLKSRKYLLLHLVVHESGSRFSTVVTVSVLSHEASNPCNRGILSESHNLTISLNSVVLEGLERDVLTPALDLLGLGENLLFSLLSSSTKTENKVKSGLLLDVVVRKSAAILELLSSENKTLLIRRDSFLILDLSLYVVDGVGRLNIECNGLTCRRQEH